MKDQRRAASIEEVELLLGDPRDPSQISEMGVDLTLIRWMLFMKPGERLKASSRPSIQ
jgi:hypothetical protein